MAVDPDKLIADARKARAAAAKRANKATKDALKEKAMASVVAESRKQMEYANTLKPTLTQYEADLGIWANKIARGDVLSKIEQKEFNKLVADYKSVNKTVDAAIKKSNDIIVEARRGTKTPTVASAPAAGPDAARASVLSSPTPGSPVDKGKTALTKTSTTDSYTAIKKKEIKPATNVDIGTPEERIKESTGNAGGGKDTGSADAEAKAAGLNQAAALDLAGTLFEHVDSLKDILNRYVKEGWTNTRFLQELRNDTWYKKNSAEIKARYTQLYNYQDLVASGQADGTTDYEKQIRTLKDQITKKAREMGSGLASDPAAIQRAAENMYITNTGIDDALTTNILASAIRPIGSTIAGKPTEGYSGKALQDYQTLQGIAKSNGFSMADIIPGGSNEQQVLQNIAMGAIDVNRIAQDARRLAAQGQPQYVRDLLGQGYNLDQVYAPYRQTMANILEIGDPQQISLNDPTLRMAISDKGDMNLYDFKKALRQDNRWQYTDTAKQEVSIAALSVLRDFGFQG